MKEEVPLLNKKIRSLRKASGLSQAYVASVCELTQSSYASIENGKTKSITIEVGKGIAKALGVPFTELFEIYGETDLPGFEKLKFIVFDAIESVDFGIKSLADGDLLTKISNEKELYHSILSDFKRVMYFYLTIQGFCTKEEIINYRQKVYERLKSSDNNTEHNM